MFDKILIANRGEIALRVLRACKELGIATVAVHSTADADAMHVQARRRERLHRPAAGARQLSQHPGAARGLRDHRRGSGASGLRLPLRERALRRNPRRPRHRLHRPEGRAYPPDGRQDRGEAQRAKRSASPCVPGSEGGVTDDDEAHAHRRRDRLSGAHQGGGRRRRARHEGRAHARTSSPTRLQTARTEAKAAFGDDAVYLEKYLAKPRHIEIQVLGDGHGDAIHLGERDCSLQRRHQKVWEEGPSPALNAEQRATIGETVRGAMRELGYLRRRHRRVPLRERRVLFHRDEHAHPGRASGDRDDHRHRSRERADPHRGRRPICRSSRTTCGSWAMPSNAGSTPRTRATFRPSPGRIDLLPPAGRARRARRFGRLSGLFDPAELRFAGRQADRAWPHAQRMPDAAAPRARRVRRRRHRHHHAAVSAPSCAIPTSRTASTTSTGSSISSRRRERERPRADHRLAEINLINSCPQAQAAAVAPELSSTSEAFGPAGARSASHFSPNLLPMRPSGRRQLRSAVSPERPGCARRRSPRRGAACSPRGPARPPRTR